MSESVQCGVCGAMQEGTEHMCKGGAYAFPCAGALRRMRVVIGRGLLDARDYPVNSDNPRFAAPYPQPEEIAVVQRSRW